MQHDVLATLCQNPNVSFGSPGPSGALWRHLETNHVEISQEYKNCIETLCRDNRLQFFRRVTRASTFFAGEREASERVIMMFVCCLT